MIYWIWLTQLPFIGPVTARYLIEELKDAENIYKADAGHLLKYRDYLNSREEAFSRIIHWNSQRKFLKTARIIIFLFYAGMTSDILYVQRNRPMRP